MKQDSVLITGAASGLGRVIALSLSRPGATLELGDRDSDGLAQTAAGCRARGAHVEARVIDVTDGPAMADWIHEAARDRLDLVFACAGITGGIPPRDAEGATYECADQVRAMMAVNLDGVLNTVLPAIAVMRRQARAHDGMRGRICAIASVAAVVSFPGTPSYCASKAAVDRFMVAQGSFLRDAGIRLTSVCCGFVDTPMVASNRFPMPGLVSADDAARRILRGVARGQRRVVFPRWLVAGSRLMDLLPIGIAELYYRRQPTGAPGTMTAL